MDDSKTFNDLAVIPSSLKYELEEEEKIGETTENLNSKFLTNSLGGPVHISAANKKLFKSKKIAMDIQNSTNKKGQHLKFNDHFPCTHVQLDPSLKVQQDVQSAQLLAKDYPDNLLNTFIYVFWSEDKVWYRAKVIKYLEITKKFKVIYDDKNQEKIDLLKE